MMNKPEQFRVPGKTLLPLSVRKDLPAVRRAAAHLGAIVVTTVALWLSLGTLWSIPLTALQGYLLAFLFSVLHETAHQTAFKTRACNAVLGHLAGFSLMYPYRYYRHFHWDHHRYTNDPERDPELARPLPPTMAGLAWYVIGVPVWFNRIRMLLVHGVLARVTARWVPNDARAQVVNEARAYLIGYALVIAISIATQSMLAVWLWALPMFVGQWFLRPYLLSEHTGCEHTPNMLENTRTTYTNAFVRFFAWNMPYHIEHHAYPSVPFHSLPKLNGMLASHLVHTSPGYLAASAAVCAHLADQQRLARANT